MCSESDASVMRVDAVLGKVRLPCFLPSKSGVLVPLLWSHQLGVYSTIDNRSASTLAPLPALLGL